MHLLERFAANCGSKYSAPLIEEAFFPLPFSSYITINKTNAHVNQIYDYWPDVVEEIYPSLDKAGIRIVEIGDKTENTQALPRVHDLRGRLNLKHFNYIIRNSTFHAGGDSFCGDIANLTKTKGCEVFGSTPAYLTRPLWHAKTTQVISPPETTPPSFGAPTPTKAINTILPEAISKIILESVGLSPAHPVYSTKFIGKGYHIPRMDIVPDFMPTPGLLAGNTIHLRLDYEFNEDSIAPWAQNERKLILVTTKELNLNIIRQHKNSILQIAYEVDENTCPNYLKALTQTGLPLCLFTRQPDLDSLKTLRLKLIDWTIEDRAPLTKKDLDTSHKIDYNTALYKSSRCVMSKGQKFPCKQAWVQNLPQEDHAPAALLNHPDFWEEQEHFRIIQPTI